MKKSRREEEQEQRQRQVNPVAAALGGLILGMLSGVAFAGWEVAMLGWFGAGAPHETGLALSVSLFAVAGGFVGAMAGITGLNEGKWAVAASLLTFAFLLSGKAAGWTSAAGVPGILGLAFFVTAVFVGAQLLARIPFPPYGQHGFAVFLVAWLAMCVPLNLHVLPTPSDTLAISVDMLFFLVALFFGLVGGVVGKSDGAPVLTIVAAGVLGWAAAWPVLDNERPWPVADGDRPPVVLVIVDGLRGDRLSYAGYERKTSPNLDKFARQSTTYLRATSVSSWTIPAMGSLLTGRVPYRHGAGIHDGYQPRDTALRADRVTLADLLRREGYSTAAVVGDMWLDTYGMDSGFERWSDDAGWGALSASVHPLAMLGLGTMGWPIQRDADTVTDDALAFLEAQSAGDWFLMVQYRDLGEPFLYAESSMEALGKTTRAYPENEYDAGVHTVDAAIGRLLKEIPRDAWVVVVGDHGTELTEGRERQIGVPVGVHSGHGMYQELLHVPMIIRAPGKQAKRVERVVSTVDLAPTILAGLDLPGFRAPEGVPLYEVVGGDKPSESIAVISQCVQYGPEQQAVRIGDDKLVRHNLGKTPMFNLADDPDEVSPLRSGANNDQLEKRLGAALTPAGAGVSYDTGTSMTSRLGVFATKVGR